MLLRVSYEREKKVYENPYRRLLRKYNKIKIIVKYLRGV
jgi:hypothetical protein